MNVDFFKREINKIPGRKTPASNRIFIQCPFREERTPSGSISLDTAYPGRIGRFYCFGCGARASWDQLAEMFGLTKLDGYATLPKDTKDINMQGVRQTLLPVQEDTISDFDFFDLQDKVWRGFKREFLIDVGARLVYHDKSGRFYVWFPVMVRGKEVGYFRAQMKKPTDKSIPSYLNSKGSWVKKRGLFPLDYALGLMKELGVTTIVLVEGPRDALRLLRLGIPAVAILGTNNWTPFKIHLLEMAGVTKVILMLDGDKAGREASAKLYPELKKRLKTKVIRLWRTAKRLGLEKMDPCSSPKELMLKLKGHLK